MAHEAERTSTCSAGRGDAQPQPAPRRARLGRVDCGGMGALRRPRRLRLHGGRHDRGRHRRPRAHAPGSGRRAAGEQPRRPLSPRALPDCDRRHRLPRAGGFRRRLLVRPQRGTDLRAGRGGRRQLHALPPRAAGDSAFARPHPRGADRLQRRDLDDREPRHARRAAGRRRARLGRQSRRRLRGGGGNDAGRGRAARAAARRGRDPADGSPSAGPRAAARRHPRGPPVAGDTPHHRADGRPDLRPRLPQRPDRRGGLPGVRRRRGRRRLPDGRARGRRPDRRVRRDDARRQAAGGADGRSRSPSGVSRSRSLRHGPTYLRRCSCWRSSAPPTASRTSPASPCCSESSPTRC